MFPQRYIGKEYKKLYGSSRANFPRRRHMKISSGVADESGEVK